MATTDHNKKLQSADSSVQKEESKEQELLYNGKWGAIITFGCFLYGQMTIASQLTPDPRVEDWILLKSSLPTILSSLVYIALVTWIGPAYMKNRNPISGLKPFMMVYNAFQVAFNLHIFLGGGINGWFGHYSLFCEPCNFSTTDPKAIGMMHATYWYYFSKLVDFLDTIFFVLHKKYDHISLLHVVHHGLMPISTWYGAKYYPGGHITFMGELNAFIHVLMYTYYLLAAMGPRVRPYLWWKKYLTTAQLIQFTAMFSHAVITLTLSECNIPIQFNRQVGTFSFLFLILFTDFYIKAYRKKSSSSPSIFQACKLDNDQLNKRFANGTLHMNGHMSNGVGAHTGAIQKTHSLEIVNNGDISQNGTVRLRPH